MKIKCDINCWTHSPEKKWKAGEEVVVSDKEAEILLKNNHFAKVTEAKKKADTKQKEEIEI